MSSLFGLSGFIAGVFGLEFLAITENDSFSLRLYNIIQSYGVKINPEMHSRSLIFQEFFDLRGCSTVSGPEIFGKKQEIILPIPQSGRRRGYPHAVLPHHPPYGSVVGGYLC